jgi:hypothetical protein
LYKAEKQEFTSPRNSCFTPAMDNKLHQHNYRLSSTSTPTSHAAACVQQQTPSDFIHHPFASKFYLLGTPPNTCLHNLLPQP